MNIIESFRPAAATLEGDFFVGLLVGYALKKIIKIVAIITGVFLVGLAYLQYHQIVNINWNKLQRVSEGASTSLSNTIIIQILGISASSSIDGHAAAATASPH